MNNFLTVYWDVSPEIFSIGPLTIRYYGLFFVFGFIFGYLIFKRIFKFEGINIDEVDKLSIFVFAGAVLGARLGHVFFYEPEYYLKNPGDILKIWQGGLASHGGAIGLFIALWFYAKRNLSRYVWIIDRMALATALAAFFIRLGNLMNSEIYGHETSLPWGFIFAGDGQTVAKHPTQIYEALCYLLVFILLWIIYHKRKTNTPKGIMIGWFMVLVFGTRFLIEFLKEVQVGFENNMILNMGQILSIPFILFGIFMIFYSRRKS